MGEQGVDTTGSWRDDLTPEERARLTSAGFGQRIGMGEKIAVVVIDAQNYMVGPPPGSTVEDWPSVCETGRDALDRLGPFLKECRTLDVPIFYTRFEVRRDGGDIGVYGRKRGLPRTEGWCLEGSIGAEIAPEVEPGPSDIVFVKKKPSGFHGTPLLGLLIERGIDTVIVTGGSTSNCVRATAVDAASYNYRTVILEDCVFDRFDRSHRTALFDLERQYADVLESTEVLEELRARGGA
jgi:nicotinamidase-related amidase